MKEVGGYIELEHNHGPLLHDAAVRLNCGRSCLAYLIRAKNIRKIALPYLMCDSVIMLCKKYGLDIRFYHIMPDLRPESIELSDGEWLYVMNYYGQYDKHELAALATRYSRIIVDNAQAYFDMPLADVDTLYTCRKFFGVADGGFLYTDTPLAETLEQDESFGRMTYLMGRFERSASEFYQDSVRNNETFDSAPVRRMSRLTENLLRGVDYDRAKKRRTENYAYLHDRLSAINQLPLRMVEGAFAYPLLLSGGAALKKKLIERKIYIPTLWPNVLQDMPEDSLEHSLANDILPLPCDQRYGTEEMENVLEAIDDVRR